MFPLLLPEDDAPGYLTLDEALAAGHASVTEVSEAGSVPELLVKNLAPSPVLILDGEELVGAKQNRIVNLTILVAAGADAAHPRVVRRGRALGAPLARVRGGRPRPLRVGPRAKSCEAVSSR